MLDAVPAVLWFVLKVYLVFCVFVWTRDTLPRLRIDQLMAFAWKFLIPLTLVNIGVSAVEVYLGLPGPAVFIVNVLLAGVFVVAWAQTLEKLSQREAGVRRPGALTPALAQRERGR